MQFKDPSLIDEYNGRSIFLKMICQDFAGYCGYNFGIDVICTRVLEKIEGSSGVHEIGHGVDFRDEHAGENIFTPQQRDEVTQFINNKYPRNDGRPTLMFHSFCNGALHCHIQIASSTDTYKPQGDKHV